MKTFHKAVGTTLIVTFVINWISSFAYLALGDDKWFSRFALSVIAIGLWYCGYRND